MHTSAFIFGVLAGLSIGPIAVLILNLALTYGPRSAVLAGLGAALGDLVWGMTAFLGGSALSAAFIGREYYFKALCSALLIGIAIWMLWIAVRRLRAGALPDAGDAARATERYGALLGTFGLTCANPLTAIVFAGFLARIDGPVNIGEACKLGLMVFLGSLLVQVMIALAGSLIRPLIRTPHRVFAVNVVSLAVLIVFALSGLL
ncbi:MAG: LysE family translocator [Thermoguttaceae bacterium]